MSCALNFTVGVTEKTANAPKAESCSLIPSAGLATVRNARPEFVGAEFNEPRVRKNDVHRATWPSTQRPRAVVMAIFTSCLYHLQLSSSYPNNDVQPGFMRTGCDFQILRI